jgi:hypothetical protein
VWVELWRKSEQGIWSLMLESKLLEAVIHLETIGADLLLADLYANTEDLPETVFRIR